MPVAARATAAARVRGAAHPSPRPRPPATPSPTRSRAPASAERRPPSACGGDALQHAVPYGIPYRNPQRTRPSRPRSTSMLRTRHLAGAIATAMLFSTAAAAADFSNVIVFGDSLSDNGNISLASAPTIQPPLRFTTNPGTTAAENVATGLGFTLAPSAAGGTDYAWGGAGFVNNVAAVPTITQQLQMYLGANGGKADSRALYQVWGGANDIFYLSGTLSDPNAISAGAVNAAQTELGVLAGLQAAGAKYVLVYNLPDLGKTPQAALGGATAQAGASQLAVLYNGVLNSGLAQLSNNGLNIIPANTYALLNEVIANPGAYGFSNVTAPAAGAGPIRVRAAPQGSGLPYSYAAGADQTYLFADGVHPTTAAHAMLGQYVLSVIHAPEQISL